MDQQETQETQESQVQEAQAQDPWIARADELKLKMEELLALQLQEYEVMNAKLEAWKESPNEPWLTQADYEPWQAALKNLEAAHHEFDDHISTRVKK